MNRSGTTRDHLRIVDGGGVPPAAQPDGDPDGPVPEHLAADLRDPLREAERRIGFILSGELGPVGAAHRLALGSALDSLSAAEAVIDLLGRPAGNGGEGERNRFDLRFAIRDVAEEMRCAARSRGVRIVLRLPEEPILLSALRPGVVRTLRFALIELMRGAPPRSRLLIRAERRAGRVETTIRGGRTDRRLAPPCRSGLSLARSFLREEGGDLVIIEGGNCWIVALPEPRETRKRTIPPVPPVRLVSTPSS
ncbi:MAG: hypothetical protein JW958_12500 [Candidatus Eisenbacteria bacterium]|nr:hypothetical protein [Candidatus Eisenbacteria bacterium]